MQKNTNRPAPKFELFESVLIPCSASTSDNPNENFGIVFAQIFDANDLHDSPEKLGWSYRVIYRKNKSNHETIFRENELEKMPDSQDETPSLTASNSSPKFQLGSQVVFIFPDREKGVPHGGLFRVKAILLNPNQSVCKHSYIIECQEKDEPRHQSIVLEKDLVKAVNFSELPDVLKRIAVDLEIILISNPSWQNDFEIKEPNFNLARLLGIVSRQIKIARDSLKPRMLLDTSLLSDPNPNNN